LIELKDSSSDARSQSRAGEILAQTGGTADVDIREAAHGFDPISAILVGITINAGSKVATELWDEVIWPRLRSRLGVRALGEREPVEDEDEAS
jgi:hypothetical protein